MSSQDPIDENLHDLAEQLARGVTIETEEIETEVKDPPINPDGDPCNFFEWSLVFLLVAVLFVLALLLHLCTLFRRRASIGAFDILAILVFAATIIQLGPMVAQVLHSGYFGEYSLSQSGCKLQFFTDYGMRHVLTFLVICFFLYAYLILFHNFNSESLDRKLSENVAWMIIVLFGLEGIFGTAAAVYVDYSPHYPRSCIWTPTMNLTARQIISMEIILRPITPYILPALVLIYPMVKLSQAVAAMDDSKVRTNIKGAIIIVYSFFGMNFPYAMLLIVEIIGQISAADMNWKTLCNVKWTCFLLHQAWFLVFPLTLIRTEVEKGNQPAGSQVAMLAWNKIREQVGHRMPLSIRGGIGSRMNNDVSINGNSNGNGHATLSA